MLAHCMRCKKDVEVQENRNQLRCSRCGKFITRKVPATGKVWLKPWRQHTVLTEQQQPKL